MREAQGLSERRACELVGIKRSSCRYELRRRKRKRLGLEERCPFVVPTRPNERWSRDFVSDGLSEGRKFRSLNVVDYYSRE